jgi:hypothetical protein
MATFQGTLDSSLASITGTDLKSLPEIKLIGQIFPRTTR